MTARFKTASKVASCLVAGLLVTSVLPGNATAFTRDTGEKTVHQFQVRGVKTVDDVARVVDAGVSIDAEILEHNALFISGSNDEAHSVRQMGFKVTEVDEQGEEISASDRGLTAKPVDNGYANHTRMVDQVNKIVQAAPNLAVKGSIGKSHEGRDLPYVKLSNNPTVDENRPEILINCNQHAREHLTVEMCLYLLRTFTTQYNSNPRIKNVMDTREIFIVPMVNPDGVEWDMSGANFKNWRITRKRNSDGSIGTDPNRNWPYKWACCNGSSSKPGAETFHGDRPLSEPETKALYDFVASRKINGQQQIRGHIDYHSYSELVLWPHGYQTEDTAPDMTAAEARKIQDLGKKMAATNGYTPEQSSDLYVNDGSILDTFWHEWKIMTYCLEMYPKGIAGGGFYPSSSVISKETSRNLDATLILMEYQYN